MVAVGLRLRLDPTYVALGVRVQPRPPSRKKRGAAGDDGYLTVNSRFSSADPIRRVYHGTQRATEPARGVARGAGRGRALGRARHRAGLPGRYGDKRADHARRDRLRRPSVSWATTRPTGCCTGHTASRGRWATSRSMPERVPDCYVPCGCTTWETRRLRKSSGCACSRVSRLPRAAA